MFLKVVDKCLLINFVIFNFLVFFLVCVLVVVYDLFRMEINKFKINNVIVILNVKVNIGLRNGFLCCKLFNGIVLFKRYLNWWIIVFM